MSITARLPFQQVDFAIPVQTFRIEYTVMGKASLPFVSEFVLRLLKLSPMSPSDIASYMGFSDKEIRIAVSYLMDLDEIAYSSDGLLVLTSKSRRYFDVSDAGEPRLTKSEDFRRSFVFDLIGFNYFRRNTRLRSPSQAIKLEISADVRSKSAKMAEKAFQKRFYEIYDIGDACDVNKKGDGKPDIYKISDVSKQRDGFYIVGQEFSLDIASNTVDRGSLESLKAQEPIVQKITESIEASRSVQNLTDIAYAMDYFEDDVGLSAIRDQDFDFAQYAIELAANKGSSDRTPFFGSLLLTENWDRVVDALESSTSQLDKNSGEFPVLRWVAPSNAFWGRTQKLCESIDAVLRSSSSEGKEADIRKLYDFQLLLPISDAKDGGQINYWKNDLRNYTKHMHAYIDGYFGGTVETVLLDGLFVFVVYHMVLPGHSIPIPLGFFSKQPEDIRRATSSLDAYFNEVTGDYNQKYVGKVF